jgi:DNA (cytosine-5)-methyltransferase 1
VVENVIQMRRWRRYRSWLESLRALGYKTREQVLDASDFGVAQSRTRLFILCDLKADPPQVAPRKHKREVARGIIDMNGTYPFSDLRAPNRAKPTLERARRAIAALGRRKSFLLVYYGSDGAGGWQRLDVPLRTITTLDRFAYVRPNGCRTHRMRMLQVPELKKAMGFPCRFMLKHGTRRDRIRLLGNAVCPPVMRAVVKALINRPSSGRPGPRRTDP